MLSPLDGVNQLRKFYRLLAEMHSLSHRLSSYKDSTTWTQLAFKPPDERSSTEARLDFYCLSTIRPAKDMVIRLEFITDDAMGESFGEIRDIIDETVRRPISECDFDEEPVASCWRSLGPSAQQVVSALRGWKDVADDNFETESGDLAMIYLNGLSNLEPVSIPQLEERIQPEFRLVRDRLLSMWKSFLASEAAGKAMAPKLTASAVRSKAQVKDNPMVVKDGDGLWWVHKDLLGPSDSD